MCTCCIYLFICSMTVGSQCTFDKTPWVWNLIHSHLKWQIAQNFSSSFTSTRLRTSRYTYPLNESLLPLLIWPDFLWQLLEQFDFPKYLWRRNFGDCIIPASFDLRPVNSLHFLWLKWLVCRRWMMQMEDHRPPTLIVTWSPSPFINLFLLCTA